MPEALRLSAFPDGDTGGNPAGVVLHAAELDDASMQAMAADIGYSETAFVFEPGSDGTIPVRYFSPISEVPFCGHATIATAVALAERDGTGPLVFRTPVGDVEIVTSLDEDGAVEAAFTSIEPVVSDIDPDALAALLEVLGLTSADLADGYPPLLSHAGNPHPEIVLADRHRFDTFTFDPAALRALMDDQGWTGTVTVLFVSSATELHARNPFPVGTVTEDPATGAAAASAGAYLRAIGKIVPPMDLVIHQGSHVGRPSLLRAHVPVTGGITVSGRAVPIPSQA
jgi:PhzF family phenazine biosynthesis protein